MGRDTIQLENAVSTISQEYLLEFSSEYDIPESLHPELPGPEEMIVEFPEGKVGVYTKFFEFCKFSHPYITIPFRYPWSLPNSFVTIQTTREKHPTMLYKTPGLLEKLEQSIFLGGRENISHRRGLAHKRSEGWDASSELIFRIESDSIEHTPNGGAVVASESSGTPSTIEKSPLDFANKDPPQTITEWGGTEDRVQDEVAYEIPPTGNASTTGVALETGLEKEVAAMRPFVNKRHCKRGSNEAEVNAPPKVLRRDHDAFRPVQITHRGKSLASMGLDAGSILSTPATQGPSTAMKSVSDAEPLSSKEAATEIPTKKVATTEVNIQFSARSPESKRLTSIPFVVGSPGSIYQPGWGVTNDYQDMANHIVPPGYFSELRHLPNADFLSQYNINLAWQVAMGSQLRLRFEQEGCGIRSARPLESDTLLEAEVDMKKAIEANNAELAKELDSLRVYFSDVQVSNNQLAEQVLNLQAQVTGEEKIKSAFEDFKKYEDDKVEQRCAEMDARLDKISVDFDEELYPHMLTAIAGRRWVIRYGLRLAVMKCAESSKIRQAFVDVVSAGLAKGMREGLNYGIEHGKAGRDLADIEAYNSEANSKLAVKEEVLLEDAIAANISQAKKKKKCKVVCHTHGIDSAHHARSDGIPVSTPTIVPQGLAILLADAATQTEAADKEEEPCPRLQRSISLPPVYNL
ncbi:hypothetical protein Tco_1221089 [Tanacetum coccineum]